MDTDLSLKIRGVKFPTPVMAASGTFGYGQEFEPLLDLNAIGALFTKGLSLKPRPGNPPPRNTPPWSRCRCADIERRRSGRQAHG